MSLFSKAQIKCKMEKIFGFCLVTLFGILGFIIPAVCHAVLIETTPIKLNCVDDPEAAPWVQVFPGKIDAEASLRTEGLLFKTMAWIRRVDVYFGGFNSAYIGGGEVSYLDIFKDKDVEVFFNGVDLSDPEVHFEKRVVKAFCPNDNFYPKTDSPIVAILAECTPPSGLLKEQENLSLPSSSSSLLPSRAEESEKPGFAIKTELISTNTAYNMWPKDKIIQCGKGQGIAVKFIKPNSDNPFDIVYFATLTVSRDEKIQQAEVLVKPAPVLSSFKDLLSSFLPARGAAAVYLDSLIE